MPTFEIELGDGKKFHVDAPDQTLAAKGLFDQLYKTWKPEDLEMYKIKNRDAFSDYIIEQRTQRKDGESDADYVKRTAGGLNTEGAAWARAHPYAAGAATLLQGVPFAGEWSDEALGAAADKLYGRDNSTNTIRGARDEMDLNHPKTATGLRLGGTAAGLAVALPAGMMALEAAGVTSGAGAAAASTPESSLAWRILSGGAKGAGAGATEGAVSGAGRGDDKRSRWDTAAEGAGTGAVFGGAVGGAMPAVSSLVKTVSRPVINHFTTKRPLEQIGLSRPAFDVLDRAATADEALVGPGAANISRGGSQAMVADAGPSMTNLLDTSLQKSGPAVAVGKRRIRDRAAASLGQATDALDNSLGPYEPIETSTRVIREGGRDARSSAYDLAYRRPIDYSSNNGRMLQSLLRRVPQEAIDHANLLMRGQGQRSRQILVRRDATGRVVFERLPDVRQLDYITRALNDWASIAEGKGKLGGMTEEARTWANLSRSIRNTTRQAVPQYGAALDLAASDIDARNALQFGQDMLTKMSRGQVAEAVQGASDAQRHFWRSGLRSYIDDLMAKTKMAFTDTNMDAREAAAAFKALSSREARDKISMILGPDEARQLFRRLDQASRGIELRANLAQNSKTMARQDMDATVKALNEDGVGAAVRKGEVPNILKRTWQAITNGGARGDQMREDQLYGEIVDFLTGPRGADAQTRLATLRAIAAAGPEGERLANQIARSIALVSGGAAYELGTQTKAQSNAMAP